MLIGVGFGAVLLSSAPAIVLYFALALWMVLPIVIVSWQAARSDVRWRGRAAAPPPAPLRKRRGSGREPRCERA
jgi:hypothetical protein